MNIALHGPFKVLGSTSLNISPRCTSIVLNDPDSWEYAFSNLHDNEPIICETIEFAIKRVVIGGQLGLAIIVDSEYDLELFGRSYQPFCELPKLSSRKHISKKQKEDA